MALIKQYFSELGRAAIRGWRRFWFSPADPAALGVMRICAGLMITYTHFVWLAHYDAFFGPHAWLNLEGWQAFVGIRQEPFLWSHFQWIESPILLGSMSFAALGVLVLFTAGLFTRVTSILSFLITVSFANRAAGSTFGLDMINAVLAMYLMVGPCGAAFSLDNVWRKKRGRVGNEQASITVNIAVRLLQLHMCVIYSFAGLGKLLGESWWNGTAMWEAFANYEYQSVDMTWLAHWPLLINFLTHFTVIWEVSYVALVWPRITRPLVILSAIPVHLGIAVCMGMSTFGLAMLIGNMAFVSPKLVRELVHALSVRRRHFDPSVNLAAPRRKSSIKPIRVG